jgi:hypothetical protein
MLSPSFTDVVATIVFWGVMLPIAGYIFQTVCSLCGADPPPFRRAVLITILVTAAAFFTFDGIGYGIVMASRDTTNLNLPPDYHYGNWLREPLYLKWQVMGLIPLLRYLPILFAVCLAATAYVFILAEPFRNCIAILAIQWTLNVVVMAILSFALSNILHVVAPSSTPTAPTAEQGTAATPVSPQMRTAPRPRPRRPEQKPPGESAPKKEAEGDSTATGSDLKSVLASHEGKEGSSQSQLREQLHALDKHLSPYLEPIKTASAPYTSHLPPVVQDFLDDGGWWLVLLALAVAVVFWLRALWRRLRRAISHKSRHRHKQRSHDKDSPLVIDLDLVGDAFTDPGPQQITVRGQPGRLRLVILAPSPSYVGDLLPEMAENLLDWLQPGLGEILDADKPRQMVWPRHPSLDRFTQRFHQLVQIPEVKGRRSPWVLISGAAHLGRQSVFLGLCVFLDKTSYQREIQVSREKWNEVLGVQKVTEEV